ncbi:STP1 protein, partial [Plasmodium ovale]
MNIYNCDKIKDASTKKTNDFFIRYKTTVLDGAIKIITKFKKAKEDGIHYKALCEELPKYVKSQRRCVRQEMQNQGQKFVNNEWNKILGALITTFNSHTIKRLCYLDDDKELDQKKYILDLHELFRNFCIEKKRRLQSTSDVDFQKCSDYLSWIEEKKREILGRDPNYDYIRQYEEYFYIHHNCNYSWLLNGAPDIICRMTTKTRAGEREDKRKPLDDTHLNPPSVTYTPPDKKQDIQYAAQPPSQRDMHMDTSTSSDSVPKVPNKNAPTADANLPSEVNTVSLFSDMNITGIDISKSGKDNNIKQKYINFSDLPAPFFGHKIPYTVRFPTHNKPSVFVDGYPVHVQHTQISRNSSNLHNIIRSPISNQKQFQEPIVQFAKYSLIPEPRDPPISHFYAALPPIPIITSGNKKLDRVILEPALPDASYFRSPS